MKIRKTSPLFLSLLLASSASCQLDSAWLDDFAGALAAQQGHEAAPAAYQPSVQRTQNPQAAAGSASTASAPAVTAAAPGERDPNLVGSWSRTDSMSSGDFSISTRQFLVVRPDGTFTAGTGDMVGGGAMGSLESRGEDSSSGRWKTQSDIVLVQAEAGWQPYARYYVEGSSLMFTFGDGTRQVWYR